MFMFIVSMDSNEGQIRGIIERRKTEEKYSREDADEFYLEI
jgi:hypothetical protein